MRTRALRPGSGAGTDGRQLFLCLSWVLVGLAVGPACQGPATPTNLHLNPGPSMRGPSPSITCPANAVVVAPGSDIQAAVDANPGPTIFCLKAGVHSLTRGIVPKSGNTFVGEYGAVLNGSAWRTIDPNQGAFVAHNQDIDDVTIRNLVISNMPSRGVHAFPWASDRWTIEYNEIAYNVTGLSAPNHSVVRHNYIHHNSGTQSSSTPLASGGAYTVYQSVNLLFENNEIAYNGAEQKVTGTTDVTFRNNLVHDNEGDGIWYDGDNSGALIEGNIVEDNGRDGISYEISGRAIIRNNNVRRSGASGILIATSKNVEIYKNALEDNYRGIQYFVNCEAVGGGKIGWDLADNTSKDNSVRVGRQSGSLATALLNLSSCTQTQLSAYLNGSKNLQFNGNSYVLPSLASDYWRWGSCCAKSWTEWQALGQDKTGLSQ